MKIIGEKINASRPGIQKKLKEKESVFFQELALRQVQKGADMLDINIGNKAQYPEETMAWLVKKIQTVTPIPLCIDSPYPELIEEGLNAYDFKNGKALINSITAEQDKINQVLPLVKKFNCSIVALPMDENGIPTQAEKRFQMAKNILGIMKKWNIPESDIYIDPLVLPVCSNHQYARIALDTLNLIKKYLPQVKTIVGLSNISYGLPVRKLINHSFLPMVMMSEIDAVILDPTDQTLMSMIDSCHLLLERDFYCQNYLKAFRQGKFKEIK